MVNWGVNATKGRSHFVGSSTFGGADDARSDFPWEQNIHIFMLNLPFFEMSAIKSNFFFFKIKKKIWEREKIKSNF